MYHRGEWLTDYSKGLADACRLEKATRFSFRSNKNTLETRYCPSVTSHQSFVMIELTVPWEERIEEAYERKLAKYQDL